MASYWRIGQTAVVRGMSRTERFASDGMICFLMFSTIRRLSGALRRFWKTSDVFFKLLLDARSFASRVRWGKKWRLGCFINAVWQSSIAPAGNNTITGSVVIMFTKVVSSHAQLKQKNAFKPSTANSTEMRCERTQKNISKRSTTRVQVTARKRGMEPTLRKKLQTAFDWSSAWLTKPQSDRTAGEKTVATRIQLGDQLEYWIYFVVSNEKKAYSLRYRNLNGMSDATTFYWNICVFISHFDDSWKRLATVSRAKWHRDC